MTQPSTVSMHDWHKIDKELTDYVGQLEMYQEVLSPEVIIRLQRLVAESRGEINLDVSEIDRQYHLFLKMQKKIVDDEGGLIQPNGLKEAATVLTSMGSVLGLFMKAKKDLNIMKGEADLKEAVLAAISELDDASRERFFETLEGFQAKARAEAA